MKKAGLIGAALLLASATAVVSAPSESAAANRANVIVQVRDIPNAPVVSIVAWAPGQDYGLRTRVQRKDGEIMEGRKGEHRIFLSSQFSEHSGGFAHAVVGGKNLRSLGSVRDNDACKFGECSPQTYVGVGIPDDLLRAEKAGFTASFRPRGQRPWDIVVSADLIAAYLAAVDSVSASFKK